MVLDTIIFIAPTIPVTDLGELLSSKNQRVTELTEVTKRKNIFFCSVVEILVYLIVKIVKDIR